MVTRESLGPLSYKVELEDASVVRRHMDNILTYLKLNQEQNWALPDMVDPLILPNLPATSAVDLPYSLVRCMCLYPHRKVKECL